MSVSGLLLCRLNNSNSFIFTRSCFSNLWSFSLPPPWTPSSWLSDYVVSQSRCWVISNTELTGYVVPLPTQEQEAGMRKSCSLYDSMTPMSVTPFSLRCAVLHRWSCAQALPCRCWWWCYRVAHSRNRAEAVKGGKEKLPTQQSTGIPAPQHSLLE